MNICLLPRWRNLPVALVIAFLAAPGASHGAGGTAPRRTSVRSPSVRRERPTGRPTLAPESPEQPSAAAATAPESPPSTLEVVQAKGGEKRIQMEFYGLEIDHLLRLLMREAGVTILKSAEVQGPITVISPEPVPLDVAFQILNSVLAMRGFTMTRTDLGIYKIVPIAQVAQTGTPVRFGDRPEDLPAGDEVITQVVPLRNVSAADAASQTRPLLSSTANVIATSTNSLIVTDTAANLARMLTIISDLENQLSGGFRVFYLQYYDATEMATLVTAVVLGRGAGGAAGPRPAWERRVAGGARTSARQQPTAAARAAGPELCYPDTRTNSLIVLATPLHLQQIEDLIEQLDQPVSLRDTYFVYAVQNLLASELAQLVGPLVDAEVRTGPAAGAARRTTRRTTTTRPSTTRTTARRRTAQSTIFPAAGGATASASPVPGDRPASGPSGEAAPLEVEPLAGAAAPRRSAEPLLIAQAQPVPPGFVPAERALGTPSAPPEPSELIAPPPGEEPYAPGTYGQATITADDNSNVLLISASPDQLDLIRQLLEKLDVLPPQVHIQAIIAEVTLRRDTSLGFQWEGLKGLYRVTEDEAFTGTFGTNFGLGAEETGSVAGFSGVITGPDEFKAVLTALTTDSHARILSTPGIFTSSGQEAQIDVSSRRPFPRGILTSTTAGAAISTSLDWESVGIVLSVTPRVTMGDVVQMEVEVSADEPGSPVKIAGEDYPSTNRRAARATVSIKNGHTVILGGLMRDTITRSASRVPLLGDLPVVGALFRSTTSKREKSELLVFLTPRVIRSTAEAAQITEEIKGELPEVPRSLQTPADGSKAPRAKRP